MSLMQFLYCSFCDSLSEPKLKSIAIALANIIDELSDNHYMQFNIVAYGNDSRLLKLSNQVVMKSNSPIEVLSYTQNEKLLYDMNIPRVIIASVKIRFNTNAGWYQKYESYNPYVNAFTYVYYINDEVLKEHLATWTIGTPGMSRLIFLAESNSMKLQLILLSNVLYQQDNCDFQVRTIDTFSVEKLQWRMKKFFEKYETYNNCTLFVYAVDITINHVMNGDARNDFKGIYGDMIALFGERHNATIRRITKISNELQMYSIDLIISFSFDFRNEKFPYHITPSVYQHDIVFIILRKNKFTPEEKLILPFDCWTWYLIIATILIGYLMILVIYQMPKYVQNFVFGKFNRIPSLTMTQIFFGIGLTQPPERNFARFLFMWYTLFCLIIRTAYQSKMYDFLQYDQRPSYVETVQEVLDKKFPVALLNSIFVRKMGEEL